MMQTRSPLVWLITGTSTGLGHELALAALDRGEAVIATTRGRSLSNLSSLQAKGAHILELDVTWPLHKIENAACQAIGIYGCIDVVVNNAGYAEFGALEEQTPEETFQQFNTNVFGALNVSRAFLPHMRSRKTGTILFMGSLRSWVQRPFTGLYGASKCALKGIAETLAAEVAPFGINCHCIDAGYFRTALLSPEHVAPYRPRIAEYAPGLRAAHECLKALDGNQLGDPRRAGEALVELVGRQRAGGLGGRGVPVSLPLGSDSYETIRAAAEAALHTLRTWKDVIISTDSQPVVRARL